MRILLITLGLLAMTGQAAAINEYGWVGFHHGTDGFGTTPGCQGEPPSGCHNIDVSGFWGAGVLSDPGHVAHVCSFGPHGEDEQPPPGLNAGAWYWNGSHTYGAGVHEGGCAGLREDAADANLFGGVGAPAGESGYGVWKGARAHAAPAHGANADAGANAGTPTTGAGAWAWADAHPGGACAAASLGTPNGGGSLGPLCV